MADKGEKTTSNGMPALKRREILLAGGATIAATLPVFNVRRAQAAEDTIRIGFVGALSGIRASFGASTAHTIEAVKAFLADGIEIDGKHYAVEIIVKDNQSTPTRSLQVGNELILNDKPDIILVCDAEGGTAIGAIADARKIPTLSTMGPWQAWAFSRRYDPAVGFPYTFHFFFGADELGTLYPKMWNKVETNKKVGTLYADNDAGRVFSDPKIGFPPAFQGAGYEIVDAGLFRLDTDDFSTQIAKFKDAGVEIVAGTAFENHMATFWNQAAQAGFQPKICTIAAGLLFPSSVDNLGARGDGMSTEVWWTPDFPFKSSLTGQTAREVADAYSASTGKQWTQPLGYDHALFEIGIAALKKSGDPKNREKVRDALASLTLDTIVGKVDFGGTPLKSIGLMHIVGGQWQASTGKFKHELAIVDNSTNPAVPVTSDLKVLAY
jgi:branched-chain amino acid transport system substrate-binding protein